VSATKHTLAGIQRTLRAAGLDAQVEGHSLTSQCPACAARDTTSTLTVSINGAGEQVTCAGGCTPENVIAAVEALLPAEPATESGSPADDGPHGTALGVGERAPSYQVEWLESKSGARKLQLPASPRPDQPAHLRAWLNCAFNLRPDRPIVDGERHGQAGPTGHIELRRRNAPPIRFEPATRITSPAKLAETLNACKVHVDGETYGFTGEHTRQIEHVVRMLCGPSTARSAEDETRAIIDELVNGATCVTGRTLRGTSGQRYEALAALRRDRATHGAFTEPPKYLIDADSGEAVVRAADLARVAREEVGSFPHGWLDGRMEALGWRRARVQGYQLPGRGGRRGPHLHYDVFIGRLPDAETADDE